MHYEYLCQNPDCGKEFEAEQKIVDPPLEKCPICNNETFPPKKLISLSSFSLKGNGWASEGYK